MSNETTDHSRNPKLSHRRLNSLDGLRGIAVLFVIAFHTLRVTGHEGPFGVVLSRLQETAWAGVDLFFVLSGFLITGILLDTRDCQNYFKIFFARRTLRIFPLYYGVLAVAILLVPAIVGAAHLPDLYPRLLANQFWLWTYTANYLQASGAHTLPGFGHFWSLAIEEQFYWFWPVVVYFASRRKVVQICVGVCLFLPVLRLVLIEVGGIREWAIRQYTFTRADALLAGALVAVVLREPELLSEFRRLVTSAIGLSFLVLAAIVVRNHYIPYEATETVVIGYSCLAILFAALVHNLATQEGRLSQLLSSPALRWFGRYSYGIYIFHWPIAQAYRAALEPRLARALGSNFYPAEFAYVIVTCVSAGVALVSWHLFEVRFLKWKEYFTYSTAEQPRKQSPPALDAQLPELSGVNS